MRSAPAVYLLLVPLLAGCSSSLNERPWQAYAWNVEAKQFTWLWMDNAATREDCLFLAEKYVASTSGLGKVGCAFQSNDEWTARVVGMFYGASDFQCLARSTSADNAKAGRTYSYILGSARQGDDWYCI